MVEEIIEDMCNGCARAEGNKCKIIREPRYLYKKRGNCFAKVNEKRAKEIEIELSKMYKQEEI